ncbi:hypothetical protein BH09VER1_BH09VER1_42870 [soil metagenome]
MSLLALKCGKCKASAPEEYYNREGFSPCPTCHTPLHVEAFPALHRPLATGTAAELIVGEEEASCFYHPASKAIMPCQSCGRFLCGLCDCEIQGEHLCPSCLDNGRKKNKIKNLENSRMLYDSIALSLTILPCLFFYLTLVTAPLALYVAIRYWKAPGSIPRRSKLRAVIAIIFASLQILGWVAVFTAIAFAVYNSGEARPHHG